MRNALDRSFRDRHLISPQIHIYEQATNFVFTRVLFWSFFFPKPCLKIRGAAYVRVFICTSKSLIEWITSFSVWKKNILIWLIAYVFQKCLCLNILIWLIAYVFQKCLCLRKMFFVLSRAWDKEKNSESPWGVEPETHLWILSHRDSTVSKAYYEVHMTRFLHIVTYCSWLSFIVFVLRYLAGCKHSFVRNFLIPSCFACYCLTMSFIHISVLKPKPLPAFCADLERFSLFLEMWWFFGIWGKIHIVPAIILKIKWSFV